MEGLGHGAFEREPGRIDFLLTALTLVEERTRGHPATVLPERRYLNSATRSIPEREGTGALALSSWFSTPCRWAPKDGQPSVPCQGAARSSMPCCPEVRTDCSLAAEGRTARRAPESRFAFLGRKTDLTTDLPAAEAMRTMTRFFFPRRTKLFSLGPNVRHERRAKGCEAAFGMSARWRGWATARACGKLVALALRRRCGRYWKKSLVTRQIRCFRSAGI